MSKKCIFIILASALVCMIGCGTNKNNADQKKNGSEELLQVGEAKGASSLPDIVFLNTVDYAETTSEGEPQSAITFYDKSGNHYVSTDEYVCSLHFEQLVREYAQGKLADKISFHTSCDTEGLEGNYNKLCELSEDEFEIVQPMEGPDVVANYEAWYGLYYDKDGKIQSIMLHERDGHGDHYADDERANEIYEWYNSTFQK